MREYVIYQDILEEGQLIGEVRGRLIGEARMLMRHLKRRFGDAADRFTVGGASPLETRIQQLNVLQLEDLGEALLDFISVADLEAWLSRD